MRNLSNLNLNALRVFETAARTGSFTDAAEELHVSQSAVSKQVAVLEAQIGEKLFERLHRKISLTQKGHNLAEIAADALKVLQDGLGNEPPSQPDQIRLICDADFALLWLLPRLPTFERANPEIRVSIKPVVALSEPPDSAQDCAIIWGRGTWQKQRYSPLMTNTVFPVASPSFFDHLDRAPDPSDVTSEMLIHDQSTHWWTAFRVVTGSKSFNPNAGRVYGQTVLCLEAAASGAGIAIGDEVSAGRYLENGRLVHLFQERLPSPDAYYFVQTQTKTEPHHVNLFKWWVIEQANEHRSHWSDYWVKSDERQK